jgi:hypothetical protein
VSARCARCGSPLAAGKSACTRCSRGGAIVASAADLQYGMRDLDGGSDLESGPAIETDDGAAPRPRKSSGTAHRRAADTLRDGTAPAPAARERPARAVSGKVVAAAAPRAAAKAAGQTAARAAPAHPNVDTAVSYGRGVMLGDDPFNASFGSHGELPALEVEGREDPPPDAPPSAAPPAESSSPPPPEESPAERRAREIHEIAGYGPPPLKPLGAPMYCVRVVLRKRVLAETLVTLSAQRKRSDDQAQSALAELGEALFALRGDARLAPVGKLLKALAGADARVGDMRAQDQKRQQSNEQEMARIDRELAACERDAGPLRDAEARAEAEIEALKAEMQRVDQQRKKTEAELEALLRAKPPVDPARVAAARAERDARHGELQTLGIRLRPLEEDLGAARRELAKHMRAIAVLQSEKQTSMAALERAQQNHRVSYGSAKDGRTQALIALANTGLKHGLGELVPDAERSAYEAAARAQHKRAEEELHRAAVASFDEKAYARGLMMLLGGSGLVFLTLALLILL